MEAPDDIHAIILETPEKSHPFGVKGVGVVERDEVHFVLAIAATQALGGPHRRRLARGEESIEFRVRREHVFRNV